MPELYLRIINIIHVTELAMNRKGAKTSQEYVAILQIRIGMDLN